MLVPEYVRTKFVWDNVKINNAYVTTVFFKYLVESE